MDKCTGVLCSEMFEKCEATREKYKIMNKTFKYKFRLKNYNRCVGYNLIDTYADDARKFSNYIVKE